MINTFIKMQNFEMKLEMLMSTLLGTSFHKPVFSLSDSSSSVIFSILFSMREIVVGTGLAIFPPALNVNIHPSQAEKHRTQYSCPEMYYIVTISSWLSTTAFRPSSMFMVQTEIEMMQKYTIKRCQHKIHGVSQRRTVPEKTWLSI